jgi:hypothetical protein
VKNARPLTCIMLALMALLVIADILIPTGYGRFPWERSAASARSTASCPAC